MTSAETPTEIVSFAYDPLGRRVLKENSAGAVRYVFEERRVLQERDGNDNVDHEFTSTLEEFGELVSDFDGSTGHVFQYDALGSTDALIDDAQTATDPYVYRAFGSIAQHTGTDVRWPAELEKE